MSVNETLGNQRSSSPPPFSPQKRVIAGLKVAGWCALIAGTVFTALSSNKLRVSLSRNWKICLNQPLSTSDKKSAKLYQKTVSKPGSSRTIELEKKINDLLDTDLLKKIFEHRKNFKDKRNLYNYVNGLTDINGKPCDIGLPQQDHPVYFAELLKNRTDDGLIRVALHRKSSELSLEVDDPALLLFPLDMFLENEENAELFDALPEEHQNFLFNISDENTMTASRKGQHELKAQKKELQKQLDEKSLKFFNTCMKKAIKQNRVAKSYIHFRKNDSYKGRCIERISIKMDKGHASELVKQLIAELYGEEDLGVIDIKVAGPQVAGRTEGIVIYIGDSKGDKAITETAKAKAAQNRDAILIKLKKLQKKNPHFFQKGLPLKKQEAPGIASMPGLSGTENFTENLCNAISKALADSQTNKKNFREKIIDAYLNSSST